MTKEQKRVVASMTAEVAAGMSEADRRNVWLNAHGRDLIQDIVGQSGLTADLYSGQMMVEPFPADFGVEIDGEIFTVTVKHNKSSQPR